MQRLLEMISAPQAKAVQASAREMMRQRFEEETKRELKKSAEIVTETHTQSGLKPWRDVATPHPDVAAGRYRQAEFAADLAQVVCGDAEDEYGVPREFFSRTYITIVRSIRNWPTTTTRTYRFDFKTSCPGSERSSSPSVAKIYLGPRLLCLRICPRLPEESCFLLRPLQFIAEQSPR